ncbi:hypothetical protein H2203_007152 [Taxawa tesnikishii (nom. ined.)]|nr:hypothetical protein H2203_007152 [Dothideales sp. JES 119]
MADSDKAPDDKTLEKALRQAVFGARKRDPDHLTVNKVRTVTEKKLSLPEGFFKSEEWKTRSKDVIQQAADADEDEVNQKSSPPVAPKSTKSRNAPEAEQSAKDHLQPNLLNRENGESAHEEEVEEEEEDGGDDDEKDGNPKAKPRGPKAAKSKRKKSVVSDKSEEEAESTPPEAEPAEEVNNEQQEETSGKQDDTTENKQGTETGDLSESEMSEVLDEPPPTKKKRQKDSSASKPKPKAKATKAASAPAKELSSDEAEIKRLQGWLLKCGIRKLWHKELAPYDSAKAKIKHLKDMLRDAGMDGRYSVEKAKAIKEQRELAADLEAVKEGAQRWGHEDDEEEQAEESGRPRRKAAQSRFVDFGDSGEDSD